MINFSEAGDYSWFNNYLNLGVIENDNFQAAQRGYCREKRNLENIEGVTLTKMTWLSLYMIRKIFFICNKLCLCYNILKIKIDYNEDKT